MSRLYQYWIPHLDGSMLAHAMEKSQISLYIRNLRDRNRNSSWICFMSICQWSIPKRSSFFGFVQWGKYDGHCHMKDSCASIKSNQRAMCMLQSRQLIHFFLFVYLIEDLSLLTLPVKLLLLTLIFFAYKRGF